MGPRPGVERTGRMAFPQLRLGEIMVMVAAVAVAAYIIRVGERSQPAWTGINGLAFRLPVYVAGALGVGLLGVMLIGVRRGLNAPVESAQHSTWLVRAGWIGWRLALLVLIGTLLTEQVRLWGIMARRAGSLSSNEPTFPVRHQLLAVAVPMVVFGAMLALLPPLSSLGPPRRRRAGWAVVSGALMPATGVVLMATFAVIPYLVIIAIHCVRNALPLRESSRWPFDVAFHAPFGRAELTCALALLALSTTTAWLAHDFRRPPGERASAIGRTARVACLMATLGMAGWLLARTLPDIQPFLAEGLAWVIDPGTLAITAAAFAALAAGLAARAVSRHLVDMPGPGRIRRLAVVWVTRTLAVVASVVVILWAAEAIARFDGVPRTILPDRLARATIDRIMAAVFSILSLAGLSRSVWETILYPPLLVSSLMALWCLARALLVPFRRGRDRPAPLDLVLADGPATRRWAWLVVATTLTCCAALVIVGAAGVVAFHLALRAMPG